MVARAEVTFTASRQISSLSSHASDMKNNSQFTLPLKIKLICRLIDLRLHISLNTAVAAVNKNKRILLYLFCIYFKDPM